MQAKAAGEEGEEGYLRLAAEEAELNRARERLTLRHKNSSRWARRALKRGINVMDAGLLPPAFCSRHLLLYLLDLAQPAWVHKVAVWLSAMPLLSCRNWAVMLYVQRSNRTCCSVPAIALHVCIAALGVPMQQSSPMQCNKSQLNTGTR